MIEYARAAFSSVHLCKLFHHYGKLDRLDLAWTVDEDLFWCMTYEALENVSEKVWSESGDMENKFYFSDSAMMQYYRLCRNYCHLYGVSLKQNPYIQKADRYVYDKLNGLYACGYGWTLHTRINHKWASGILFCVDDNFDAYMELIKALLEIFCFYEIELKVLKRALKVQNKNEIKKEAA